jgi:hypothetical protein
MSMLGNIEAGLRRRKWLESLKWSVLIGIVLIFVLGYAGVRGNERANCLTEMAVIYDGRAIDLADVFHALRAIDGKSGGLTWR